MRVAVILLPCITALAAAQLQDADGGAPQKGLPIALRSARLQRLPSSRPIAPTQSVFANQRLRRPIPFKSRPGPGDDGFGAGPGNYPTGKPAPPRPVLPSAPAFSQPVKPVNEEPEEDERFRDSSHNDDRDDDRQFSQEEDEFEDESEENVPRTPNFGTSGSGGSSRGSGNSGGSNPPQSQITQVQYRPFTPAIPTGRGAPATAPPPPVPVVQYRPSQKPTKPRKQIVEEPIRQTVKVPPKPVKSPQAYDSRGKKPVAQIIRRYRNDNSDGSITWGFENDDGSYKEELIGIDCITRGKYGYIDPDGIRREYTYETGIKCDEEQREEDEENGFVDYQENKIVLPDGKTIDLSSMGKKQTRRPRPF